MWVRKPLAPKKKRIWHLTASGEVTACGLTVPPQWIARDAEDRPDKANICRTCRRKG